MEKCHVRHDTVPPFGMLIEYREDLPQWTDGDFVFKDSLPPVKSSLNKSILVEFFVCAY